MKASSVSQAIPDTSKGKMQLAKTCSTCKFARFAKKSSCFGSGKKQGGICVVFIKDELPKEPSYYPPARLNLNSVESDLRYALRAGKQIPNKADYLNAVRLQLIQNNVGNEWAESRLKECDEYYDECIAWHDYWVKNFKDARLCHRQTTCGLFEEAHKHRESYAKGIASGKRVLEKDW